MTAPTINSATGEGIISRRYLSGPFFPAGSYVTRPQPYLRARIFAPVEIHAKELDGSQPGNLEPLLLRVDGLDAESAPHVTLELEGVAQQIRPFTYSPQKFYVADTSMPSERPRIFVVTPRDLTAAELEALRPGDIDIGRSGGQLDARIRVPNGQRFIDAKVTVFKHQLRDPGDGPNNDGFTSMEELLSWYYILYDNLGVRLLQYYQQGGNTNTYSVIATDAMRAEQVDTLMRAGKSTTPLPFAVWKNLRSSATAMEEVIRTISVQRLF